MRTAIAAAVSSLALLAGIAAPASGAQVAAQDSVTGAGILVVFAGTQLQQTFDVTIDARSGPTGEQPSGTVAFRGSSLPVTCLSVSRHQAYVGAAFNPNLLFGVADASALGGPDFLAISPVSAVLTRCPPADSVEGVFSGPIRSGDFTVVDAPPAPTSKSQCKNEAWKPYGFQNQGQCIAFVERGTKPTS